MMTNLLNVVMTGNLLYNVVMTGHPSDGKTTRLSMARARELITLN